MPYSTDDRAAANSTRAHGTRARCSTQDVNLDNLRHAEGLAGGYPRGFLSHRHTREIGILYVTTCHHHKTSDVTAWQHHKTGDAK